MLFKQLGNRLMDFKAVFGLLKYSGKGNESCSEDAGSLNML